MVQCPKRLESSKNPSFFSPLNFFDGFSESCKISDRNMIIIVFSDMTPYTLAG
jgi:hypothetical protein